MRYNRKHGMTGTPTYQCWVSMRYRCLNNSCRYYKDYGGRGITICERWNSFKNFLEDMGEKPERMSLERINNSMGYSPENCRWALQSEQTRNRRSNRLSQEKADLIREKYSLGGITQKQLALEYGVDRSLISYVVRNKIWS